MAPVPGRGRAARVMDVDGCQRRIERERRTVAIMEEAFGHARERRHREGADGAFSV